MKKFFAAAAAALMIFAACGAEAALLRVGTDADFQPYASITRRRAERTQALT